MKIAHFADCHLGYRTGNKTQNGINIREIDGYNALNEIVTQIIDEGVDIIILAGDLFHSPEPTVKTYEMASKILQKIPRDIPIYCITGNHDTFDNKTVPSSIIPLHIPELNIFMYETPYELKIIDNVAFHLVSHHNFDDQPETMERLKPIEGKINILVTHGSVYDEITKMVIHSNLSPREIVIPQDIIEMDWDLVLLGHIHTRQKIGDKAWYAGSAIRRGWVDGEGSRGWYLWEVLDDGSITQKEFSIWQRPQIERSIDCDNLAPHEIEDIAREALKEILEEAGEHQPIVRLHFENMTIEQKGSVNWQRSQDLISQCLTYTTKITLKDHHIAVSTLESVSGAGSIQESFKDFWERKIETIKEDLQEDVKEKTSDYIQKGIEEVLGER